MPSEGKRVHLLQKRSPVLTRNEGLFLILVDSILVEAVSKMSSKGPMGIPRQEKAGCGSYGRASFSEVIQTSRMGELVFWNEHSFTNAKHSAP